MQEYFAKWCTIDNTGLTSSLRHKLVNDSIVWDVENDNKLPHYDHIEMSGFYVSGIINYGVDENRNLKLMRHITFPSIREIPNNTNGSFSYNFNLDDSAQIYISGNEIKDDKVKSVIFDGKLSIKSISNSGIGITRTLFPCSDYTAFIEKITIENLTLKSLDLLIKSPCILNILNSSQFYDNKQIIMHAALANKSCDYFSGDDFNFNFTLKKKQYKTFYLVFSAHTYGKDIKFNVKKKEQKRNKLIKELSSNLFLKTPDATINTAFSYAKLRGCESIFETKGGLLHSPGGGDYYAALWANDQCEYMNPLFPFIGYKKGNMQSINCYELYMSYMDKKAEKPLVSSIIAEGTDFWAGAGDRGDAAMFAYGAGRFCLAYGDRHTASQLYKGITWCLTYSLKKKNSAGVIISDSDELEGRFEAGSANLSTSCLLYDALKSAAILAEEFDNTEKSQFYLKEAELLKDAIENYFGANIEGYDTYRYYDGNTVLRSWICLPLSMGIFDRADQTIKALFSERLWVNGGLVTQAGEKTFWDRSSLYALRGVFAAGQADMAYHYLNEYTNLRLLGEHIPYPVEAYPEGNQRHLSAESGLYIRVFTEGLFGIRPTGFKSFDCTPQLPVQFDYAILQKIKAFKSNFDIEVYRINNNIRLIVKIKNQVIFDETKTQGHTFKVILP